MSRALPVEPYTLYRVFKYTVYALLTFNIYVFFMEDHGAAAEMFRGGITLANLVNAYSATIDTIAWVVLLLLFELETAVIPDRYLQGSLKIIIRLVRAVCYGFIGWACLGYINKYLDITALVPWTGGDPCQGDTEYRYVFDIDEYFPLVGAVCDTLRDQPLWQIEGTRILGTAAALRDATWLAVVDIINSATWIIVVLTLEIEVFLQLRGQLTDARMRGFKVLKSVLYATLLGCAIYWGLKGDFFPDFWDAFLWLVAFVFIELNIFEWQAETSRGKPQTASQVNPARS